MSSKKPAWLENVEKKITEKINEIATEEMRKFKQEFEIDEEKEIEISYMPRYPFVKLGIELPIQFYDMKRDIYITNKKYHEDLGFEELSSEESEDILIGRLSDLDKMLIEEIRNKFNGEVKVYKNSYGTIYIVIRYNKYSIRVVKTDIDC